MVKMHDSDEAIKLELTGGKMIGDIIGDADGIKIGIDVGT